MKKIVCLIFCSSMLFACGQVKISSELSTTTVPTTTTLAMTTQLEDRYQKDVIREMVTFYVRMDQFGFSSPEDISPQTLAIFSHFFAGLGIKTKQGKELGEIKLVDLVNAYNTYFSQTYTGEQVLALIEKYSQTKGVVFKRLKEFSLDDKTLLDISENALVYYEEGQRLILVQHEVAFPAPYLVASSAKWEYGEDYVKVLVEAREKGYQSFYVIVKENHKEYERNTRKSKYYIHAVEK